MSWRKRVDERRQRQQILDELNAQRLGIERVIVLWVLPVSFVVGALLAIWALR